MARITYILLCLAIGLAVLLPRPTVANQCARHLQSLSTIPQIISPDDLVHAISEKAFQKLQSSATELVTLDSNIYRVREKDKPVRHVFVLHGEDEVLSKLHWVNPQLSKLTAAKKKNLQALATAMAGKRPKMTPAQKKAMATLREQGTHLYVGELSGTTSARTSEAGVEMDTDEETSYVDYRGLLSSHHSSNSIVLLNVNLNRTSVGRLFHEAEHIRLLVSEELPHPSDLKKIRQEALEFGERPPFNARQEWALEFVTEVRANRVEFGSLGKALEWTKKRGYDPFWKEKSLQENYDEAVKIVDALDRDKIEGL